MSDLVYFLITFEVVNLYFTSR